MLVKNFKDLGCIRTWRAVGTVFAQSAQNPAQFAVPHKQGVVDLFQNSGS